MCYLYINYKDIPSYNVILTVFKKVDNIHVLQYNFKYQYSKEEIDNNILEHTKCLENEVNTKYKSELDEILKIIPVINSKKVKEINPIFNNMNDVTKRKIFSFIYWKYKNENSDEKVNIANLKKILGFGNDAKEMFIEPFKVSKTCPKCNGNGIIYVYNYELSCLTYECLTCGHKEKDNSYHDEFNILLNCSCESCINIKKELYIVLKKNIKKLYNDLKDAVCNEYFGISDIQVPPQKQMEEDFRFYRGNLTAIENEVLSFKPSTTSELCKIIETIKNRNSIYSKQNIDILNKLKEHKVIYIINEKIDKERLENLLANNIIQNNIEVYSSNNLITDTDKKKILLQQLYDRLDEIDFDSFNNIYKGNLTFKLDDILVRFEYSQYRFQYTIDLTDKYYNKKIIINSNYLKNEIIDNDIEELKKKELIKRIFRSDPENNVYQLLKNKYENYIVVPNCHFSDIFDINFFYKILSDKECIYLKTCIIDFIIFNKDGYPLKAIELQKGGHHNDLDWVWKDNTKKKALRTLGYELEEYF